MRQDSKLKESIAKLRKEDLSLLRFFISQNQPSINSIQQAIQHLNREYGDFNVYLLVKNLENHYMRYYENDTEHLNYLKEIIGQSGCSDAIKNALLKNINLSNYDQKIFRFLKNIKEYRRNDVYILAEKCAEKGIVLQEHHLLHLTLKLKNMSSYSEAVYDMLASHIEENGVRKTVAMFNEMLNNPDPNHVEKEAAKFANPHVAPVEAEPDNSVEILGSFSLEQRERSAQSLDNTRLRQSTQNDNNKPRQSWTRGVSRTPPVQATNAAKDKEEATYVAPAVAPKTTQKPVDVVRLPYLHPKINPQDLADNKIANNGKLVKPRNANAPEYTVYKPGELGRGANGIVTLAQINGTGEWIALKQIPAELAASMVGEIESLQASKNLKFTHKGFDGTLYIGMKLEEGMELHALLEKTTDKTNPARLSEAQRLLIAKKILKGAVDIHVDKNTIVETTSFRSNLKATTEKKNVLEERKAKEKRQLHRDIKPDNMVINTALDTKHIDFGYAEMVTRDNPGFSGGVTGTPGFIAPEIRARDMQHNYSDKTEVYALGVSLMEVFNVERVNIRVVNVDGYDQEDVIHRTYVIDPVKARNHDPELIRLIERMTDQDPNNRPSVIEAYALLNKIIDNSKNNNPTNPVGLKAYAVSIEDYEKARQNGNEQDFVKSIAKKGVNSIAFYSTNPNVNPEALISAQRAFTEVGIIHIAPDLYCNQNVAVNLRNIENYYNRTFGSPATQLDSKIRGEDSVKLIERVTDPKATQQELIQMTEFVIQQLNGPGGKDFYNNAGKQLIRQLLKSPGIESVLADKHTKDPRNRAELLKEAISKTSPPLMSIPTTRKIEALVKQAPQNEANQRAIQTQSSGKF